MSENDLNYIKPEQEESEYHLTDDPITNQWLDGIYTYLKKNKLKYLQMDGLGRRLLLQFHGEPSPVRQIIGINPKQNMLDFHTSLLTCPADLILLINDYLIKKNWLLAYGCFKLDHRDGEITYEYTFPYVFFPFNEEAFELMMFAGLTTVKKTQKELARLTGGFLTDEEKKECFIQMKSLSKRLIP